MNGIEENMEEPFVQNKLIPVMREAITTVQMLLFKELRRDIQTRYTDAIEPHHTRLAGAVINNLFGTQPEDREVAVFAASNRELVELELRELASRLSPLLPLVTDALRMKTICDNQEGIHSIASLLMARALGILLESRPLPMPSTFMLQVRTLAIQHGLVEPMEQSSTPFSGEPPA
ncbi:MAG: hypothetical protein GXY53_06115 [Desulfobulbus sp.]|nr:hypothetical protein [Desulfobulbus sp.]